MRLANLTGVTTLQLESSHGTPRTRIMLYANYISVTLGGGHIRSQAISRGNPDHGSSARTGRCRHTGPVSPCGRGQLSRRGPPVERKHQPEAGGDPGPGLSPLGGSPSSVHTCTQMTLRSLRGHNLSPTRRSCISSIQRLPAPQTTPAWPAILPGSKPWASGELFNLQGSLTHLFFKRLLKGVRTR